MDKYQASSSCPKLPSHMSGREMTAGSKERPKRGKRKKGYCPQQSRCHYCFVMCMTLLQKVDRKVDAVLAKVGQNEEMIRDLRGSSADIRKKVVKRGRSVPNNHYKFQGPMSIGGLQICGDGVNNFNLCSISKEWERYGNFTNGQSSWKTSPPPDEKNQTAGNTRWTDRGSDSNARDCKMNHDNHAGWDVDKQGMSDIDDGGKISDLSDLPDTSGSDLIDDCSPGGASDGSGLTSILQSSPGQGSAQKTYPCDSLKSLKDLTSSDKEVNPKAAEEVGMPKKGTSLTVSSRQGSDSLTKASVEASSDERSDVGLGTETHSSARSENTGSLQGKTCSTGSDPLLAASLAINHTGSDKHFSSKAKLAQSKIQNECFSPKGKDTLAENLSQCQDGFAVSHQQTNNGDCEQTGNDCMQTASDQQECKRPQPCSIPSTVQTERGDWHMSETRPPICRG